MNFLELVQSTYREAGAAGSPPSTVLNSTGEVARIINWVRNADFDIQNLWVNWKFLRGAASMHTTSGNRAIVTGAPTNVAEWDFDTFQLTYATGETPSPIKAYEYEAVKSEPLDPNDTGAPWRVVVLPDNSLRVDGVPDAAYPLTADYYNAPARMTVANASTSLIPARFDYVIVGLALIRYGQYENASEMVEQGQSMFTDYLARLENSQLPNQKNARFRTGSQLQVIAG